MNGKLVVMGPAGCGQSTLVRANARVLGVRWIGADDLHDAAARDKMARGIGVSDVDRDPWLRRGAAPSRTISRSSPARPCNGATATNCVPVSRA